MEIKVGAEGIKTSSVEAKVGGVGTITVSVVTKEGEGGITITFSSSKTGKIREFQL